MKLKKIIFVAFWASMYVLPSMAQTEKLSIAQCVEYALKNNNGMKNSALDQQRAQAQVNQIKGVGLPQITGSVDLNFNIGIPSQFLPDFISPAVYGVLLREGVLPPTTPIPAAGIFPAQFGTNYSAAAGLALSQIIFSPSYLIGLKAAKESKNLYQNQTNISAFNLKETVQKAALGYIVAQKRQQILVANLDRLKEALRQTEGYYKAGFVEKIDVDRLTVTQNNLLVEAQNVAQLVALAGAALKYTMGMPLATELVITDDLDQLTAAAPELNETLNVEKRPEYQTANSGKTLQELSLRNAKAAYLPNLVGFATVGANAGANEFGRLKNFTGTNKSWFGYQIVGFKLAVPVFNGFQTKYKIQEAKIDLQKTQNTINDLGQVFELQTTQAKTNLKASYERLAIQKQNLALAQEVLRVSQIKYKEGLGSNLEVVSAEASLKETQTNYFVAMYEFLVAKVDYNKALGNL